MTPSTLFEAIGRGETDQVRQLVTDHPSWLQTLNAQHATPLLWAVYTGQKAVRDLIWSHLQEPTVWEAAAVGNHAHLAAILAADPTKINATAADGFQPLGLTAFFGHVALLRWLLDQGADPNVTAANPMRVRPIHSATAHRDFEKGQQMVAALIDAGAEVNIAQHGGWTPLHQAAAHGAAALVDLLLAHGADRKARSEDGRTPAEMARANGFETLAETLK